MRLVGRVLLCAAPVLATSGLGAQSSHVQADWSWEIRALDGEATTLEEFRGEVLFINLWASWCAPCIRELESIERLRERVPEVRFLIVAAESEGPVRTFLRRYSYDLPFYLEVSRAPSAFGVRGIPTTWIVDRRGRIVLVRHGEAVWDSDPVEAFLRRLMEPSRPSATAGTSPSAGRSAPAPRPARPGPSRRP